MKLIKLTKDFIQTTLIRPDKNLNTRAFHLYSINGKTPINKYDITNTIHDLDAIPKCASSDCDNEAPYINYKKGYRKFCSHKCAANDETVKNKRKKTNVKKYGTENIFQSKEFKENMKKWNDANFYEKNIKIPSKVLRDFNHYKREVYRITRQQPLHLLDNHGKCGYNLDHKFSIYYGFFNCITPVYIGNLNNLIYLTEIENKSKSIECSIWINDLIIV